MRWVLQFFSQKIIKICLKKFQRVSDELQCSASTQKILVDAVRYFLEKSLVFRFLIQDLRFFRTDFMFSCYFVQKQVLFGNKFKQFQV